LGIFEFILIACVIGFVVWLVQTYAPIPPVFKTVVLWAGIIVIVLILLKALGIFPSGDYQIPRIK